MDDSSLWNTEAFRTAGAMARKYGERVLTDDSRVRLAHIQAHLIRRHDGDFKSYHDELSEKIAEVWATLEKYESNLPLATMIIGDIFLRLLCATAQDNPNHPLNDVKNRLN